MDSPNLSLLLFYGFWLFSIIFVPLVLVGSEIPNTVTKPLTNKIFLLLLLLLLFFLPNDENERDEQHQQQRQRQHLFAVLRTVFPSIESHAVVIRHRETQNVCKRETEKVARETDANGNHRNQRRRHVHLGRERPHLRGTRKKSSH